MARPKSTAPPSYRLHRGTGQAVVTIDGKGHYLGKHGTPASHAAYDRLIAEWLAHGRSLPPKIKQPDSPTAELTVVELCNKFQNWAAQEYGVKKRGEYQNCLDAMRPLIAMFGRLPAERFGPNALRQVRQAMLDGTHRSPRPDEKAVQPLSRTTAASRTHKVVRIFRWGVARQLISGKVLTELEALEPLRIGKPGVKESEPVGPVDEAVVNATIPHLPDPTNSMVTLLLLTGMRPGEICIMRTRDLDMSGSVWCYRPSDHKNKHRGKDRTVWIGPAGQEVLRPHLKRDIERFIFSPRAAREERYRQLREARKSKVQPSQKNRKKQRAKRLPGERYTVNSLAGAIRRACQKAKMEHWAPNQLRHAAGTRFRSQFGVDMARTLLGHSGLDATAIYAEADRTKAIEVMSKLG